MVETGKNHEHRIKDFNSLALTRETVRCNFVKGISGMIESDLWPALRDYWHPAAFFEEVCDKPLAVRLLDEPIAVCRVGDRLAAFHDLCIQRRREAVPVRRTPLSLGWVEGDSIICAYHGWAYGVNGKCSGSPRSEPIAVCRVGDRLAAFHDLCIHRGTPLSLGWVEGDSIICAYHGWAYGVNGVNGKCVRIPSIPPEHPIPKKACLTTYLAQEKYGIVWVCLSDKPRAPIPDFSPIEDPGFRLVVHDKRPWKCSAARTIENFLDFSHFPWVHEGILGDRANPRTPDVTTERDDETIRFTIGNEPDGLHSASYQRYYWVTRPFACHIGRVEADGRAERLYFACTPHSARECTRFTLIGRNYEPGPSDGARIEDVEDLVAEQDRVIVENQRPEELPLDLSEELHVKGPDTASIEYRRMMKALGVESRISHMDHKFCRTECRFLV